MKHILSNQIMMSLFLCLLTAALLPNSVPAQDPDKPLLSEAIREAVATAGIEAAKKQFSEMDQARRERYEVDMEGISELINAYVEAENYEAAAALSEITAPFMQDMAARAMEEYAPEMAEMMAEEQQRQTEAEQPESNHQAERERREKERMAGFRGEPRDDLDRFTGLYADPDAEDSGRRLWVTVSCDGYLVSGAMWGDAAPWWMRSESDNVFTFENSFGNIRMEFVTGGGSVEMIHNLDFLNSPLVRTGDLPPGWDSCMERRRR